MGHNNVIELNGKRYDAITGAYLGKSKAVVQPVLTPAMPIHRGRVIDGFVKNVPRVAAPAHSQSKTVTAPSPGAAKKKMKPALHRRADTRPIKPHQPEHAKTLMRKAVQKPKPHLKPSLKTQIPAEIAAPPVSAIAHKRSALQVDEMRLARAGQTAKHHRVHHFPKQAAGPTYIAPLKVRTPHPATEFSRPTPRTAAQAAPRQPHTDIFEAAIARATSHQQSITPKVARKHRHKKRVLNVLAAVAAFVVIGGFFAFLNMPKIELRIASMQAGFSAAMPDYRPTGYELAGGVKREHGKVILTFASGDSSFNITQQASNWNSQTLLDNTVSTGEEHETIESKGRIIHVYEGANASWVDRGIRFDITGNAHLSTDDIVALATSM